MHKNVQTNTITTSKSDKLVKNNFEAAIKLAAYLNILDNYQLQTKQKRVYYF